MRATLAAVLLLCLGTALARESWGEGVEGGEGGTGFKRVYVCHPPF